MNVSSVKNLNGEVLSAVQDASLTNVVQTNSGNWQDITAYQNASATYLTAVDLSPYATTAEVDTLSSMLSGAIDYVSANSSGTLTGDAQGAVDTVYNISGSIISGTRSNKNFTATNVDNIKINSITIGKNNTITADRAGLPWDNWSIGNNFVHLGPEFMPDYWQQYQRVYLDKTGLSSMSGTSPDKKLIWKAILNTDIEGNNNTITAINGSALAAGGDEFPASANEAITAYQTNSATYLTAHQAISADEWNDCYDNVNTNSGAWGGSALPISAGPGIKVNLVDNTLVFSNDETVLWSGSWKPGNGTVVTNSAIEISESVSNFEYIRIVTEGILCQTITVTPNQCQALICYPESDNRTSILGLKISKDDDTHIRFRCGYSDNFILAYRSNSDWGYFTLKKIIGINRIANN